MKHILLVEDELSTQIWFSELLREAFGKVRIIIADAIHQAQELVYEYPFNLAIVDIYLPDGQGFEFIRKIKPVKPGLFCVVVTAFDDSKTIFDALSAGADGYLLKSQDKDKLVRQLQDITDGSPPLSPSVARRIIKHFDTSSKAHMRSEVPLTQREKEVLQHIAKGMTRIEIAQGLGIKPGTVAGYIKRVYEKLNITSRAQAALEARRLGLV